MFMLRIHHVLSVFTRFSSRMYYVLYALCPCYGFFKHVQNSVTSDNNTSILVCTTVLLRCRGFSGADPGFQFRGAHLKKLRRAEGDAKFFGVFRVKNHDFTPKKIIFFPILGGGGRCVGCAPPGSAPVFGRLT